MSWIGLLLEQWGMHKDVVRVLVLPLHFIFVLLAVILPFHYWTSFLKRKIAADLQARVGPNRAGWGGILQPFVDFLKLMQKTPRTLSRPQRAAYLLYLFSLFTSMATLPIGASWLVVHSELSALIPFWSAFLVTLATLLLGLEKGGVAGWMGGLRVAAQGVSAALPAMICLLAASLRASGFSWLAIVEQQGPSPLTWGWLSFFPFQAISFAVFVVSGLALLGQEPFGAPYSSRELQGGVSALVSGEDLAGFEFGRFFVFFHWLLMAVTLYLGGWALPEFLSGWLAAENRIILTAFFELFWVGLKAAGLLFVIHWVALSLPRLRLDQVTEFAWKFLTPLALVSLFGTAAWTLFWRGGGV